MGFDFKKLFLEIAKLVIDKVLVERNKTRREKKKPSQEVNEFDI